MEVIIFDFWLLIIAALVIFSIIKKNALTLLLAGAFLFGFGGVLNNDGLRIVNGINKSSGAFTYLHLTSTTDGLIAMFALATIPVAITVMLFSLTILFSELTARYRLFNS